MEAESKTEFVENIGTAILGLVRGYSANPDSIQFGVRVQGGLSIIEVSFPAGHRGAVIGRGGRYAKAIEELLRAIDDQHDIRLEIVYLEKA